MTEIKPKEWEPGSQFEGCTWRYTGHYHRKVYPFDLNDTFSIHRVEIFEVTHPDRPNTFIHKYLN